MVRRWDYSKYLIVFNLIFLSLIILNIPFSTSSAIRIILPQQGEQYWRNDSISLSSQLIEHEPIEIYSNNEFIAIANIEGWPGDGSQSSPIIIDGLSIIGTPFISCIGIWETNLYFQISNCHLSEGLVGIHLSNTSYGYITNNTISNANGGNNQRGGIHLSSGSNNNIILNNSIYNVEFPYDIIGNNNSIISNTLFNNINAIWVNGSDNIIANNSIQDAKGGPGILIKDSSNTRISNNFLYNNHQGIVLENSDDNLITYNSIIDSGYGVSLILHSDNNLVSLNTFYRNTQGSISQAYDNGKNNIFTQNFWNDWVSPDMDEDGFVDSPYMIDGPANNSDPFPLISIDQINNLHTLSIPIIEKPTEGSQLNKTTIIHWKPSIDSKGHSVMYNLSFSLDEGMNWVNIVSALSVNFYTWDTSTLPFDAQVLIQIVASCSDGCWLSNYVQVVTKKGSLIDTNFILFFITILGGLIVTGGLSYYAYNSQIFRQKSFVDYFQSEKIEFLKPIYHKVIVGLENITTAIIFETMESPLLEEPTTPISLAKWFPTDYRSELKSELKGRTVLTLIEIAFLYAEEANLTILAQNLNIPPSTLSNELRKLVKLNYLDFHVSPQVLHDGRSRHYIITPKGISFLKILKSALELTIRRIKEKKQSNVI
ncbi:MAG: NosD domain-containing protein [Candidatus Hodarchaeota archaeon]